MWHRLVTIKCIPAALTFFLFSCHNEEQVDTPVTKAAYRSLAVQKDGRADGAWGYMIFHNEHAVIQQFTIPALQGSRQFGNRAAAETVGNLVADKLNHAMHPGISRAELDSLGITSPDKQ